MPKEDLKYKPLVEAILELRWELEKAVGKGLPADPHYRILLGRFSERVRDEYPHHEPLASASVPDQLVAHTAQHRFRATAGGWPLVQLGPGLLTINETDGYTWTDFQRRCEAGVKRLMDAYPGEQGMRVQQIALRYIDAVAFDYSKENAFGFIKEKMKTTMALPSNLFTGNQVQPDPASFKWEVSYPNKRPEGVVTFHIGTGSRKGEPVIVWETLVVSKSPSIPELPDGFPAWLSEAHDITDDWFFKIIEGDLHRRFSGG